jgi:hypothetical protein
LSGHFHIQIKRSFTMRKFFLLVCLFVSLAFFSSPSSAQYVSATLAAQQHGGSGGGTPSLAGTPCTNGNYGTSVTCTLTPHSTSNLLVAAGWIVGTTALNTPTGCGTWTVQAHTATTNYKIWATATPTTTSSCTVTMTQSGSSNSMAIAVWEAVNTIATVDGTPGFAEGYHGSNFSGPSTTTTVSNDLIFAFAVNNGTVTINAQSPFTADLEGTVDSSYYVSSAHDVQSSAGSISCSYVVQSGGGTYDTAIMALEP